MSTDLRSLREYNEPTCAAVLAMIKVLLFYVHVSGGPCEFKVDKPSILYLSKSEAPMLC